MIWLRAVRVHQWTKNTLIFVPTLAAHLALDGPLLLSLLTAFISFCLLASAMYLLNDLADLEHDSTHPLKRERPLASGLISPRSGLAVAVASSVVSLVLALRLPPTFLGAWGAYLGLTGLYSLGLKRIVMLDVVVLAGLYTLRVVAGAAAVSVSLSPWFLAFSVFLFASLALLKRMVETQGVTERDEPRLPGRGWLASDAPVLLAYGAASSVAAALVYCLYITGEEVLRLYSRPDVLWLGLPLILYWLGRVWLLAARGAVLEDPLLFALRDRVSYLSLVVGACIVWAAT